MKTILLLDCKATHIYANNKIKPREKEKWGNEKGI